MSGVYLQWDYAHVVKGDGRQGTATFAKATCQINLAVNQGT
jgi:hypothetical protein